MSNLAEAFRRMAPPRRIRLRSGPVTYRKVGSGPPLLLVHGWGGSSIHWVTTLEHFASLRTVYAMDMPGHGQSPPLAEMTSAERMAEWVIEFADAMGIERFELNGHSFGAAVAAYVAARYPERVERLVISSFGIPGTPQERLMMAQVYYPMNLLLQIWHPWFNLWYPWQTFWQLWMVGASYNPLVTTMVAQPFFQQIPNDLDFPLLRSALEEFLLMDQRTSLENTISLGNPALHTALTAIEAPTLLITGRQDMIVPAHTVASAAQNIPDARLVLLDECGHVPMIEQPEAYHQVVDDFLTTRPVNHAAAA